MFYDKGFIWKGSQFTQGHLLIMEDVDSSWVITMGFINMLPALIPDLCLKNTDRERQSFPAVDSSCDLMIRFNIDL